jgi:CheY-like chemotaxis protein
MSLNAYNILVVDDDPGILAVMAKVLASELPNRIVTAGTGTDAMQVLDKEEVGVLLCDMIMPGVDGIQILKYARERSPQVVSLLVTAQMDRESMVKAINEGGIWKLVEKPWKPRDLVALVREALQRHDEAMRKRGSFSDLAGYVQAVLPATPGPGTLPRVKKTPQPGMLKRLVGRAKVKAPDPKAFPLVDARYRITEMVKEGGTGCVYRAEDSLLRMPVAIKVLYDRFSKDQRFLSLLFDEARLAMQLSHKHIVRLHNLQQTGDLYYLIMEYIDGTTFREILRKHGPLPAKTVLQVAAISADALGYAHRRRIFHRDLKPDNLMLSKDGILKIIDFGLACLAGVKRQDNTVCGTPYYISPEELAGKTIDARSDLYSLAVTVHELLVGRMPLPEGQPPPDMFNAVPVVSRRLPEPVRAVLEKALAREQANRYEDVAAFSEALRQVLPEG